EPAAALREIRDARDRGRRARRRYRGLSGVPQPSRPLVLHLGSTGPVVSMGVSMAPRVPRAVPHGRPARLRETIIVSSAGDYSMAPWLCLRPLPRQQRPQRDDVALVAHADRGRRGARGPALGFGSGDRAGREEAVGHGLDEGPAAAAADELALAREH